MAEDRDEARRLPLLVKLWLAAAIAVALCPPLHWAASGAEPILGVPRGLAYVLGASAFAAAGVVVAYLLDRGRA